jgi:hypothetical protein
MTKKPTSLPILCDRYGEWKEKLEKCLPTSERITLLALGNVKFDVLGYVNARKDIEIVKLETRHMKKHQKGTGLKLVVRKRMQPRPSKNE